MKTKITWYLYESNEHHCQGYWILYQKVDDKYYRVAHATLDIMALRENAYAKGIKNNHLLTMKEADAFQEYLALCKSKQISNSKNNVKKISENKGKKILKELCHQWKNIN